MIVAHRALYECPTRPDTDALVVPPFRRHSLCDKRAASLGRGNGDMCVAKRPAESIREVKSRRYEDVEFGLSRPSQLQ